jgi:murein DD-endopeptidase MepM/ murein hydrolase activator NlpD
MARNLVSVTTPQNLGRHYGIQVYLYTITATDGMPLTHYCHLDESLVIDDAIVTVGQEIGISGDTGATNVHLHFEYWTCNAGGTPQHSQGNNLPSGGLYTCKKPPKPFILSPDANAPVIPPLDDPLAPGIVEYNDSVRVTLRMNSNELDLSWIEFRAKVNADLIIDESVSMWSHCNAGNEPNGDVQNGVSSVFQDDDGNVNVMRIDPDEFHSWDLYQQIKFTFKVPGYRPGTGRVCVKATDFNWNVGSFGTFNGECEFPNVDQPTFLRVAQNKPNPFNPSTTYRFETGGRMQVTARVYDSAGRYVATICDEVLGPGEHSVVWGGLDDESRLVGSGVYFVRVDAGAHQGTVRSVLLR